jgi:hypothetical protein
LDLSGGSIGFAIEMDENEDADAGVPKIIELL